MGLGIFQDKLQLSVVCVYELPVCETCTPEVNVVVWLWVENVVPKVDFVFFDFLFYYKAHEAEWQVKCAVSQDPVMIISIDLMPSTGVKSLLNFVIRIVKAESLNLAPLMNHIDLIALNHVRIPLVVPKNFIFSLNIKDKSFLLLSLNIKHQK